MPKLETAVVLLAGYGTRCLPFTKVLPKAMIPILNKPVIHYIVEELEACGIQKAIFVLPKTCNGRVVKQYFSQNKKYQNFLKSRNKSDALQSLQKIRTCLTIKYIFTNKANGSFGALYQAKKHIKNKDFAVLNGDDLFYGAILPLQQMIAFYIKTGKSVIGTGEVAEDKKQNYGIVETKQKNFDLILKNLLEKPRPEQTRSNLALFGRYIFTPDILRTKNKLKKHNGEFYLTDAILTASKQQEIYVCQLQAKRYDCGSMEGLLQASNELFPPAIK